MLVNFLKYNENIMLTSSKPPTKYLSIRSNLEKKIYLLQLFDESANITSYDNFSDCIFEIIPRLSYKALKMYRNNELKKNKEKREIIEKRYKREQEQNERKILKSKGKVVKIGDIVHIRHINSQNYVSFSPDKNFEQMNKKENNNNQIIMNTQATEYLDSSMTFMINIDPNLSFKKYGDQISYDDSFYFQNIKLSSTISFKDSQAIDFKYKFNDPESSFAMNFTMPSVMERSLILRCYEVNHVFKSPKIDTFRVILVAKNQQQDKKGDEAYYYGDFVRIKHVIKNSNEEGYINNEFNICGTNPVPLLRIQNDLVNQSINSIFQIVPLRQEFIGLQIKLSHKLPTEILLRHWLTGRYLKINQKNLPLQLNPCLDDIILEHNLLEEISRNNSKDYINDQNILIKQQKKSQWEFRKISSSNMIIQFTLNNSAQQSILNTPLNQSLQTSPILDEKEKKFEYIQTKDTQLTSLQILDQYTIQNSVFIHSIVKDNQKLSKMSRFKISTTAQDNYVKFIKVNSNPIDIEETLQKFKAPFKGWLQNQNCFENIYKQIQQNEEQNYEIQSDDDFDFFFMERVEVEQVQNVQSVLSKMYPLMILCFQPLIIKQANFDNQAIKQALQNLMKLCCWMCDIHEMESVEYILSMKVNPTKQQIMREIGMIEIIQYILYQLKCADYLNDMQNNKIEYFPLTVMIITFLRLVIKNNHMNSFYVFQWYQMMKDIVLSNDKLDKEIEIDKLLQELFNMTELNIIYIQRDDIRHIAQQLDYEKYKITAFNLLLSFCTYNKQISQDKKSYEKIINEVFQKNEQIFRKFIYENKQLMVQIKDEHTVEINQALEITNQEQFKYIKATLMLINEISKGDAGLVIEYISEICPFQTSIMAFSDQEIHSEFRSLFLDIFLNCYLNFDSRYNVQQKFPNLLKIKKNVKLSQTTLFQIEDQKINFKYKYCNPHENINEKTTNIKKYLKQNLMKFATIDYIKLEVGDHQRINSFLNMLYFFLSKKYYTDKEVAKIHPYLDELIKNIYCFLKGQKKQNQGADPDSENQINGESLYDGSFKWIMTAFECLYYIEQHEQNQMIEQFFVLPSSQIDYSQSINEFLMKPNMPISQIKSNWSTIQQKKRDHILKFLDCIEIPDTEVIYYYLQFLNFGENNLTESVVKIIYEIFNMKSNLVTGINDICFIYESNINLYNLVAEEYYKQQMIVVDLQNIKGNEDNCQRYQDFYYQIEQSLDKLASLIFLNYQMSKTTHEIEHQMQGDIVHSKSIHNIKNQKFMEITNRVQIQNKILKNMQLKKFHYVWRMLDYFSFDIRTAQLKQDILRHIKFYYIQMKIISFIAKNSNLQKDVEQKQQIVEISLAILIFICNKNSQNSNIIADDQQLLDQFVTDLHLIPYQSTQKYILFFISELFRDNYYLLIKLEKEQINLFNLMLKQFTRVFLLNKRKKQLDNLVQFDYCIYFIQMLEYFFRIKNANLTQNQLWIFDLLYKQNISGVFQNLSEFCLTCKLINDEGTIVVPNKIILFCNILNMYRMLIDAGKHKSRLIQEVQCFLSLKTITNLLKNMDNWYFLKQELLIFVNNIYVQNKKLSDDQKNELFILFKDIIVLELDQYINKHHEISQEDKFETSLENIFQIYTSYSTRQKLICQSLKDNAYFYIIYGIIEPLSQYIKINFNLTEYTFSQIRLINKLFIQLQKLDSIWRTSEEIRDKQERPETEQAVQEFQRQKGYLEQMEIIKKVKQMDILIKDFFESEKTLNLKIQQKTLENEEQNLLQVWSNIKQINSPIIDDKQIINFQQSEMDMLIGLLVKIRLKNTEEFKNIITNLINLLNQKETSTKIKNQAIRILRNLANFNAQEEMAIEIKKDLCSLQFTSVICSVISNEQTDEAAKYEYLITLIDFLDEGKIAQQSLFQFCKEDVNNKFIISLYNYIQNNFNDVQEYEKGLQQKGDQESDNHGLRTVIDSKIDCCVTAIKILIVGCQGHYAPLQNHLRDQSSEDNVSFQKKNMVEFIVELFGQYIQFYNAKNVVLGETMLQFLIQSVQGPCQNNQYNLCETQILEYLEDLQINLTPKDFKSLSIVDLELAPLSKLIYIFIQSLFESTTDSYILNKVEMFLNPQILIKRLMYLYQNIIKNDKKIVIKTISRILNQNIKTDKNDNFNIFSQFFSQSNMNEQKQKQETKNDLQKEEQLESHESNEEQFNFLLNNEEESKLQTLDVIDEQYGELIDYLKEEGEQLFILMKTMSLQCKQFKDKYLKIRQEMKDKKFDKYELDLYKRTMKYFKINTKSIEIINKLNQIQIQYFAIPEVCKYLSESTMENFLENVKRDGANDKIGGLLKKANDFIDEMTHFKFIMTNIPFNVDTLFTRCRWIVLLFAFSINLLILFDHFENECEECMNKDEITDPCVCTSIPTKLQNSIQYYGLVIISVNILNFVLWAVLKLKLDLLNAFNSFEFNIREEKKLEKFQTKKSSMLDLPTEVIKAAEFMKELMRQTVEKYTYIAKYMFFNSYFLYLSGYALITIVGIVFNRIFFTFLLLDIIEKSLLLQYIIKAVSTNGNQLMMTSILGIVVMYIYGMLAYYSQDLHSTMSMLQQNAPICVDPLNCFIFVFDQGVRAGGGVGDLLVQPFPDQTRLFYLRFFYDVSFFIIIIVILLKVIFGIIIDTFAQLREEKNFQDADRKNNCFICSLEKTVFEKEGIYFEEHIENEHNTWNYLYYIVHLKYKNQMEYSGIESTIHHKYLDDDMSWFPIGKALSLQSVEEENTEDKYGQIIEQINHHVGKMLKNYEKYFKNSKDLQKNFDE